MRTIFFIIFAAFLTFWGSADVLAQSIVTLRIWQPEIVPAYKLGEPISILIEISNQSSSQITLRDSDDIDERANAYLVDVKGLGGKQADFTAAGRRAYGGDHVFNPGVYRASALAAGAKIVHELRLEKIYNIVTPGHYVVRIGRDIELGPTTKRIWSNNLMIEVQ